jgi:acyl dehydratase
MPRTRLDLSVVGKKGKESVFNYNWKDVILYALGIGVQADELPFVYERVSEGLKVIPSFATIVGMGALIFPGNIDFSRYVHGEQLIKLHRPFSPSGEILRRGEVINIFDKGKGAVIHTNVSGYSKDNEPIFDAKWIHFYIGEGGFGGDPGPKAEPLNPPEGVEPDFSVTYKTNENQAALYRLSGDFNPLHLDPEFARRGGQEKPILHGLCTYGFATRAILSALCNNDVTRFKEFKARFSNVVYPGETLTTEGWKDNGRYIIQVRTKRAIVINNSYTIIE